MRDTVDITNEELDELFERYRQAPESYVFVPLADACRKIERVEEALEICERGVSRHPDYASGHVVMGKCLYDLGKGGEARQAFERVLQLDENNLVALKYMGTIEAEAGRFETAREYLEHILRLDPENREIKLSLLHLGEQEYQGEPSIDLSDEAVESEGEETPSGLETSDELATATLADIFAAQGYREKAREIYQELLNRQPGNELIKRKIAILDRESVEEGREGESKGKEADPAGRGEAIRLPASDDVDEVEDDSVGFEEIMEKSAEKPVRARRPFKDASRPKKREGAGKPKPRTPPKPVIDEKENLNHFKRWLSRLTD